MNIRASFANFCASACASSRRVRKGAGVVEPVEEDDESVEEDEMVESVMVESVMVESVEDGVLFASVEEDGMVESVEEDGMVESVEEDSFGSVEDEVVEVVEGGNGVVFSKGITTIDVSFR